jgi:chromosomal replication initiation ATPase DnaA
VISEASARKRIAEIAEGHGRPLRELLEQNRDPTLARIRWQMMRELRDGGLSLPTIGRLMHRDHKTVHYGLQRLTLLEK